MGVEIFEEESESDFDLWLLLKLLDSIAIMRMKVSRAFEMRWPLKFLRRKVKVILTCGCC